MALAEQVAAAYVEAWIAGDPDRVGQPYTEDAALVDDLRGLSARGSAEIATPSDGHAPLVLLNLAEVSPQELEFPPEVDPDAPAVFLTFELDHAEVPTQVWLMVRSAVPCPGDSVVALHLDDEQRITAERRYAAVGSMRACMDPADLPQGWWTVRGLPLPFSERITGSLETAGGRVEIRNGRQPADTAVRRAFGQFAAAGLSAPVGSTLTFDPFDQRCQQSPGHAQWSGGTTEVLICDDSSQIGEPAADGDPAELPDRGHMLLHEIGRAWLVNETDEATRVAFLAHVGVGNRNDKGRPWRERGVEWAAESLA